MNKQKFFASRFIMAIFGATGDLTYRKLMPALYRLFHHGVFDENSQIVGFARRPLTDDEFRNKMKKAVIHSDIFKEDSWKRFASLLFYQQGRFEEKDAYKNLGQVLDQFDERHNDCCNKLFYLATPPKHYETILDNLNSMRLTRGCGKEGFIRNASYSSAGGRGWTRLLIEKPFGKDLESARKLDLKLGSIFDERQIYRIDHYLGKEAIQNIITFRFANGIFEPVWNKDYIDHIQITMAETLGIEGRGSFYDDIGALRDVMQNHILAMLSLIAMEQPRSFSSEDVREARCKVIQALRCIEEQEVEKYVIRGQYEKGIVNGESATGYLNEKGISINSNTETFVSIKTFVENERWVNIPWYLRTGKRLKENSVEISVVFRQTCHILFREYGCPEEGNVLTFRVSPNEGIAIRFITKEPGHAFSLKNADLDFNYQKSFQKQEVVEAYEFLLEDALVGDQMLFARSDELESSWQFITKILHRWRNKEAVPIHRYKAGSWGPEEAQELIEKDGRKWILT